MGKPVRPLVVVPDYLTEDSIEQHILGDIADIRLLAATSEKDAINGLKGADAILLYHDVQLGLASIDAIAGCKVIVRCGVGYDNVDIRSAGEHGIPVCNVPDYGTEDVADHALMLMLGLESSMKPFGVANGRLRKCWVSLDCGGKQLVLLDVAE